jgi:hypothetical protein
LATGLVGFAHRDPPACLSNVWAKLKPSNDGKVNPHLKS